jgi:hypothetical protein
MARRALTFKQGDVTRMVKAVVAAGVDIARVEVGPNGTIVIVVGKAVRAETVEGSELDEWMEKHKCESG